jgi:multiple antibiotic resistance protein
VLAVIMVFGQAEHSDLLVSGAAFVAWLLSSIVFLCAEPIYNLIKEKGLDACQRLMGLIVALIAVQQFLEGISGAFKK